MMPRSHPVLTHQESIWLGQAINLAHAERIHNADNTLIDGDGDDDMFIRAEILFWQTKETHKEIGVAVKRTEEENNETV